MKIYITYGTVDYLANLVRKHQDKNLRLMANNKTGILFHETTIKSIFNQPKTFEIVGSYGDLENGSYAVCNHIPVSDEGRPLFEKRMSDLLRMIEREPGLSAFRVLRPAKGDTYIILTLWDNEKYFHAWQESDTYDKVHKSSVSKAGIGQPLASAPYMTNYSSVNLDE